MGKLVGRIKVGGSVEQHIMNLRDLEYLVAVHDLKHFRKAAERCFVSQPTLSGQLRKLEDSLGLALIERSSRQVLFTEAGEAMVKHARRVLAAVDDLKESAQAFRDPLAGEITMGIIPTLAPYLLPRVMPALYQQMPRLCWELVEAQTAVLLEQLRRGELDVLLLARTPEMAGFSSIELFKEPLELAVPRDHPLASRPEIGLKQLDGERVLLLEDGNCLRDHAMGYCISAGAAEDDSFRATSLETLRQMVAAGRGITLVPALAVPPPEQRGELVVYRSFTPPLPTRDIILLFRNGSPREACFAEIAKHICSCISDATFVN